MKKCLTMAAALGLSLLMGITAYAGTWRQDQTGYWYAESDGSYAVSQWMKVDGSWYYFDGTGYMQKGWLQDGGIWYYLDPSSGAMVSDTARLIDGVSYQFDASGAMLETQQMAGSGQTGWTGSTFTSNVMNYQITVPDRYVNVDTSLFDEYIDYQMVLCEFGVGRPDSEAMVVSVCYPNYSMVTANDMATVMTGVLTAEGSPYTLRERAAVNLGGGTYEVVKLNLSGKLYQDLYIKKEGDNILLLQMVYAPEHESEISGIAGTVRNIR